MKDFKRNGQGETTVTNGDKYVGEYKDDKCNGYGEFYWKNGNVYKG